MLSLCSCYFNSAGHIFDAASYDARVRMDDLKANSGQYVYTNGNDYYVELPRYRTGKPVKTQYGPLFDDTRTYQLKRRGTELCKVPADFGQYLMGVRSGTIPCSKIDFMETPDEVKNACSKYHIVRNGCGGSFDYEYTSPNAAWLYTAGVFDWLCVDLPITCVENALGVAVVGLGAMNHLEEAGRTGYTGSSEVQESSSTTCTLCGGMGIMIMRGKTKSCPACNGGSFWSFF